MTPQERKEKRRVILLNLATDATLEDRLDQIEGALKALDALDTPPLFEQVMTASERYVTRFGGELSEEGTAKKFDEEAIEFKCALQIAASHQRDEELMRKSPVLSPYLDISKKEVARELIDCLVTLGGMASHIGLTWEEIEQAARDTLDKLDTRTTADYAWYPSIKQVAKKSKMGEGQ